MICIKTHIPKKICEIDDELKAIYHSKNSICIWVLLDHYSSINLNY